jgi:hypothetical protein
MQRCSDDVVVRRTRLITCLGVAVLTAALLGLAPVAQAKPLNAPGARTSGTRLVTLLTGERVLVGSVDGTPTARVIRATRTGAEAQLTTMRLNGDVYVIPAVARPYLQRYLDPALFDVTQLAGANGPNRTMVRIGYTGAMPSLPGVTITSASGGVATGYVTPASARRFGAALAAQALADARAGWPKKSALFGSVTSIAPIPPPPSSVEPDFPMVTLIIRETTHTGAPVPFGGGILMNADNGMKYAAFVFVVDGEARVSLPRGHYIGIFDQFDFSKSGNVVYRVIPVSDYTVNGDLQTLVIDGRLARVSPSVTAPRPTAPQELVVDLSGTDRPGNFSFDFGYDLLPPGARILLAPDAPPAVGSFTESTRWILLDPAVAGGRYSYDASFTDAGVPVDQSHAIPGPARTERIDQRYDSDRLLRIGGAARLVFAPGQGFAFASFNPIPLPLRRSDYVFAPAGSIQQQSAFQDGNAWDPGFIDEGFLPLVAGTSRPDSWFRSPYTLTVPNATPADFPLCYACRSGTGLTFVEFPSDGVKIHTGEAFTSPTGRPVAHFTVYRNGVQILSETDSFGDIVDVPAGRATYRVVQDLDRTFTDSSLSTSIRNDVTFVSSGQTGNEMPANWFCFTARTCRVLQVLRAYTNLHASPQGSVPVGRTTFDVAVDHIQAAVQSPIKGVSVAVQAAGSTTWMPLTVTKAGPGHYRVAFTARRAWSGVAFNLRVTATDVDGGILRQVTTRAFLVS